MSEARREPAHAHFAPPSTIPTAHLYLHAGDWTAEAAGGGGTAQSAPRTAQLLCAYMAAVVYATTVCHTSAEEHSAGALEVFMLSN